MGKRHKGIKIIITSQFEYIRVATNCVLNIIREYYDILEDEIIEMRLALYEALTNSIQHGYDMKKNKEILIWCIPRQNEMSVVVEDMGIGITKQITANIHLPDDDAESGRGLYIIDEIMGKTHFTSAKDVDTQLIMTKKYKSKEK